MSSLKTKIIIISSCLLIIYSCATSYAPNNWLPDTDQIQQESYGGWLTLFYDPDSTSIYEKEPMINGEFIGIDSNYVYVFSKDGLVTVKKEDVINAILELDDKNTGTYAALSALGALSTISNGYFLVFTFPLWVITGISASSGESFRDRYVEELPATTYWQDVQKFARFPQGIPPDLDLNELKPKSNPGIQYN